MTLLIIALSLLIVLLFYVTYNLIRKIERLEDAYESHHKFVEELSEVIAMSTTRLKEIDASGTFEADDEIGWFFNSVKEIQQELDTFKLEEK